jgi:hypothetical protein
VTNKKREIVKVEKQIELLRNKLYEIIKSKELHMLNPEVIKISCQLDELIVKLIKLSK